LRTEGLEQRRAIDFRGNRQTVRVKETTPLIARGQYRGRRLKLGAKVREACRSTQLEETRRPKQEIASAW
jgi:hypothetical protein